jgi:hypothetical protein
MDRITGSTTISLNVDVLASGPWDARSIIPYYSGLTDNVTLPYPYEGMVVTVYDDIDVSKNGIYYCTFRGTNIPFANSEATWEKVGSGEGTLTGGTVVNNKISGATISGYTQYWGEVDSVTGGYLSAGTLYLTGTGFLNSGVTIDGFSTLTNNPFTGGTSNAGTGGTTDLTASLIISGQTTGTTIDLENVLTFTNSEPTKRFAGGIPIGSTIFQSGKTIHQILQEIFYPVDYPEITNISTTISRNSGSPGFSLNPLQIVGTSGIVTLTAGYVSGTSVVTGNASTSRKTGPVLQYLYSGAGITTPIVNTTNDTSNAATVTQSPYTAVTGYNRWRVEVSHDVGQQPVDDSLQSYNSNETTQFTQSGKVYTNFVTIEGVYPIYANSVTLTTETQQPLYSNLVKVGCTAGVNSPTNLGGIVIYFAQGDDDYNAIYFKVPTYMINNLGTPSVYVYNFNSQVYSDVTDGWIITNTTMTINSSTVDYKLYTWNKSARGKFGDRYIRLCF